MKISDDEMNAMLTAMSRLGFSKKDIKKAICKNEEKNEETRGRKKTSLRKGKKFGSFGIIQARPPQLHRSRAKIRVDNIPKLQSDLVYHNSIKKVTNKRGVVLFESPWLITGKTVRALHRQFCSKDESNVSMGTFLSLCPFYARMPKI